MILNVKNLERELFSENIKNHSLKMDIPLRDDQVVINGPFSWTCYSFGDRIFHIFGEYHNTVTHYEGSNGCSDLDNRFEVRNPGRECMSFAVLLTELSRKAVREEKYVDIFLERDYIPYGTGFDVVSRSYETYRNCVRKSLGNPEYVPHGNRYGLNDVNVIFTPCLTHDKTACPYLPYSKFHYTDLRRLGDPNLENFTRTAVNYQSIFCALLSNYSLTSGNLFAREMRKFEALARNLWGGDVDLYLQIMIAKFNIDDYENYVYSLFSREFLDREENELLKLMVTEDFVALKHGRHPVRIQMKKLHSEGILIRGQSINTLIAGYFINEYHLSGIRDRMINFSRTSTSDISLQALGERYEALTKALFSYGYGPNFAMLIGMDLYVLPRLFRSFSPKKSTVITLTGELHADFYRKFFEKMLRVRKLGEYKAPDLYMGYVIIERGLFLPDDVEESV